MLGLLLAARMLVGDSARGAIKTVLGISLFSRKIRYQTLYRRHHLRREIKQPGRVQARKRRGADW